MIRATYAVWAVQTGITLFSPFNCVLFSIVWSTGFTATRPVVLAIAVDRFKAIVTPFAYRAKFRKVNSFTILLVIQNKTFIV